MTPTRSQRQPRPANRVRTRVQCKPGVEVIFNDYIEENFTEDPVSEVHALMTSPGTVLDHLGIALLPRRIISIPEQMPLHQRSLSHLRKSRRQSQCIHHCLTDWRVQKVRKIYFYKDARANILFLSDTAEFCETKYWPAE